MQAVFHDNSTTSCHNFARWFYKMATYSKQHIYNWTISPIGAVSGENYVCGFCGNSVGPMNGILGQLLVARQRSGITGKIYLCPVCTQPTFFDGISQQVPVPRIGAEVRNVPEDGIRQLYDEARDCIAAGAFTACVMVCRKILMNLAVREGAPQNQSFVEYVDYLAANNHIHVKGKPWVDRIRKNGNYATHEIPQVKEADAKDSLYLVEMLLRFNFELITPETP